MPEPEKKTTKEKTQKSEEKNLEPINEKAKPQTVESTEDLNIAEKVIPSIMDEDEDKGLTDLEKARRKLFKNKVAESKKDKDKLTEKIEVKTPAETMQEEQPPKQQDPPKDRAQMRADAMAEVERNRLERFNKQKDF